MPGLPRKKTRRTIPYNGLQGSVRLQNKHGLSGELDYTYSHTIDLTDGDLATVDNPFYLKYMKGNGSYDRRQMLGGTTSTVCPSSTRPAGWLTPFGRLQIAGTFIKETGEPNAASFGGVNDPVGLGGATPTSPMSLTKSPTITRSMTGLIPTPTAESDHLRQIRWRHRSPAMLVVRTSVSATEEKTPSSARELPISQTSLYKSFAMTERAHFEFRAESYNTFNHTEFTSINSSWSNSLGGQYGTATADRGPRVLQLGAKMCSNPILNRGAAGNPLPRPFSFVPMNCPRVR